VTLRENKTIRWMLNAKVLKFSLFVCPVIRDKTHRVCLSKLHSACLMLFTESMSCSLLNIYVCRPNSSSLAEDISDDGMSTNSSVVVSSNNYYLP